MKLPNVPSEGFLQALPPEERKKLGRAGMTKGEAKEKFLSGQEKELQQTVYQWLLYHEIYFEWDRMDRRTSGKRGRADFRCCVGGLWLSIECKADTGRLSKEQASEAARLRKSGGKFVVAFNLQDVIEAVRDIDSL
jgi:hypothetical protein